MKLSVREIYKNCERYFDEEIILEGWIRNLRSSKAFGFIELNDGTFFNSIQVVFNSDMSNFNEVEKLHLSSSIKVSGTLISTPNAKQPFEIQAKEIKVEGESSADYPLNI